MGALRQKQGLTLLEVLIAIALGSLLVLGALSLWREAQLAYLEGVDAADLQQDLRVALGQVVRVVRQAGANPTRIADWEPFLEAGTHCLHVLSDLRGNGDVEDAWENVRFDIGADSLRQRNGDSPPQRLATGIVANQDGAPVFRYFTIGGSEIPAGGPCGMTRANRDAIALVRVALTARHQVPGQAITRTLVSDVRPRNWSVP